MIENKEIQTKDYAARLEIDYPQELDRLSTFFRLFLLIPIGIILALVSGTGETVSNTVFLDQAGNVIRRSSESVGGIASGIMLAAALMILFRQVYPRWWFDFMRELSRFQTRVGAYAMLMTDQYPSTVDQQSVHLELDYPDVKKDLKRGMPLVKWFLAIPHYFVLVFLGIAAFFAVIFAWFAIIFTGKYPQGLFNFVLGVMRWGLRVNAYAFLLITDQYPPFSLN